MRKSIEISLAAIVIFAALICAAGAFAAEGGTETYVSLLVQPEWLKANLDKVILIDARAQSLYKGQQGHLPGAVNAEWTYFANMNGKAGDPTYGAVFDAAATAKKIGALGIDGKKDIVVYGDGGDWGNAGFVVWLLRMAGVNNARILDGGFTVYRAAGGKTSDKTTANKAVAFAGTKRDDSYIVNTDWMKENYNNQEIKVVDVRGADEYTGKIRPFGERRPGHIPGAVNLSWDSVYTKDFKVLPEGELTAIFENAGFADKNQTIVCYDTSGVRGAFMTMMFRLAGYANARCYNPSYQAWCADTNTEITQGPNP
ncbi:MAG: sulfurtransferase [Synergistaceae bacterium]|jgi:3-mercaptopyruvate sulfurtransferase SseA|nr:sulfurtransferase [Synergistaceae bacterium]